MAAWLLTGSSWAILTAHTLWFALLGREMWRFWGMRKKLKIHARSPTLALLSGVGGAYMQFVIMVFELGAQEGTTIPCTVMLYSNAIFMALYPVPYLLRGLRVVIVSDKAWRAKYSTILSLRNVKMIIFGAFITLFLASVMLQFVSQQTYGPNATEVCFALDDWWFYGPTCGTFAAISSKLFIMLARVQDRIHMSKEISSAAIAWLVTAVPFYASFILNDFGVLVAPRELNFLLSGCIVLTDLSTFFIEPRRHKGEIQICQSKRKKTVVVIDGPQIAQWKEQWHNSRVIMNEPTLDLAFEKHVQDHLCSESYDFLKALDVYLEEAATVEPEPQFKKFREIVDMYILAGSELEVNIETAMRNKVLKIGDETEFLAAVADRRRDIFNPSGTEIRKMLDENLLKTFLTSTAFFDTCKRLDEEHEQTTSMSTMFEPQRMQTTTLLMPFDGPVLEHEDEG